MNNKNNVYKHVTLCSNTGTSLSIRDIVLTVNQFGFTIASAPLQGLARREDRPSVWVGLARRRIDPARESGSFRRICNEEVGLALRGLYQR